MDEQPNPLSCPTLSAAQPHLLPTPSAAHLVAPQLGNCEQEINSSVAKGMTQMGLTVDRLANLYSEQAGREATAFDEPMKEYVRLLSACKQAASKPCTGVHL